MKQTLTEIADLISGMKREEVPECWLPTPSEWNEVIDGGVSRQDLLMHWFDEFLCEQEDMSLCPDQV